MGEDRNLEFIAHRINTVAELKALDPNYGVELDLRDSGDRLIMVHDPFNDGEDFEDYLKVYKHGTMILNIKSERIEDKVQALIEKYQIPKYFYLDSSLPMIVQLAKQGQKNVAVRLSEYESIETVMNFAGKVDWVWIDCFTKLPLDQKDFVRLKDAGFKLCFVSPELQGQDDKLETYKASFNEQGIILDAVCTKHYNIPRWQS
ncbi:MAG: hypothetical protein QNL04_10015 [SAR324 cluster bacterium]|nr:hypothetical protein [SAR324 cluster bacterium]